MNFNKKGYMIDFCDYDENDNVDDVLNCTYQREGDIETRIAKEENRQKKYIFKYEGNLITEIEEFRDDELRKKTTIEYNKNNLPIELKEFDKDGNLNKIKYNCKFDKDNQFLTYTDEFNNNKRIFKYEYNENGKIKEIILCDESNNKLSSEVYYYKDQNLETIESLLYDREGKITNISNKLFLEYDNHGNPTKILEPSRYRNTLTEYTYEYY